jgi:hypothetical protein
MLDTKDITRRAGATPDHADHSDRATGRSARADIGGAAAGAGAITFAVTVIAQNLIRGASAPGNGASAAEVLTHYSDHRAIIFVLMGTYVLSGIGLAVFLGGALRRMLASSSRGWALSGLVGATCVMALFALVVAAEQALTVVAHQDHLDIGAMQALWALHNSVFTVLDFSIAIALLGLFRAGVADGMTPAVFARLAPVGCGLLLVGTLAGPSIAVGDPMALFGVTALGFLVWLAFLLTTGVRLIRSREAA